MRQARGACHRPDTGCSRCCAPSAVPSGSLNWWVGKVLERAVRACDAVGGEQLGSVMLWVVSG
jgi:hypothetical protein